MIEPPRGDSAPDEPDGTDSTESTDNTDAAAPAADRAVDPGSDGGEGSVQPAAGPRHSVANSPGPRLTVADLGALHSSEAEPPPAIGDSPEGDQETSATPPVPPGTDLARRLARAATLPAPEPDAADVFESRAPRRPGPLDRARRGMRWLFAPAGGRLDETQEVIDEEMPVAPVRPWLSERARVEAARPSPPLAVPPGWQRDEPEPEPAEERGLTAEAQPEPATEPEVEPAAEPRADTGPRPGEDLARRLAEANMNSLSNTLMGTSSSVPTETPIETPAEAEPEAEPRRYRPWQRPVPTPAEQARRSAAPTTPVATTAKPAGKPPAKKEQHGHPWRAFAIVLVLVVLGALGLRAYVISPYFIPTGSMELTLHGCTGCNNDHVLVNRLSYRLHPVRRGDVVVFNRPSTWHTAEKLLIKRVIGLPGDTLTTVNGVVYVNGQELVEPYLNPQCTAPVTTSLPRTTVPPHTVFVMGDNRCNSDDSRFFGPVPTSAIVGRAFIVIWPLKRLRWL